MAPAAAEQALTAQLGQRCGASVVVATRGLLWRDRRLSGGRLIAAFQPCAAGGGGLGGLQACQRAG